ncbi:MAG: PAS domain S-box protein [Proteobacteria bacterium]|nr:PAS domain S-box protein [Pseudomonadota bacterium]
MRKTSISRFFITYQLFAVTLPLVLLGITGLFISSNILESALTRANNRQVHQLSQSIELYLTSLEEEIGVVHGILSQGVSVSSTEMTSVFKALTEAHSNVLGIQVANRGGVVLGVFPDNESIIGTDVSGHEYFKETIMRNALFWAPTFVSELLDTPVASLSVPSKLGVITIFLTLNKIGDLVAQRNAQTTDSIVFVTDQRGVFIVHPDENKVLEQEYDPRFRLNRKIWDGTVQTNLVDFKGEPYFAHVIFMADTGWKLALFRARSSLHEPVRSMAYWLLSLTVLATLLAILLGKRFESGILESLSTLINSTKKISRGDYKIPIPEIKFSELAQLSDSFEQMAEDICSREEMLIETRTYLSNVIDSMPSIIIGVDLDGTVTQWNRHAEITTGLSTLEAIGQELETVFPDLAGKMDRIKTAIVERKEQIDRNKVSIKEGVICYQDVTIYPLIANGVVGVVIRIDDVTEKVKLENLMIQNEKMLSVGGLAVGMAHEINNPLAGLLQTANVMGNRLDDSLDLPDSLEAAGKAGTSTKAIQQFMEARGIPRMLSAINESGTRIANIVSNMLSFAGKKDTGKGSHQLSELIDRTLELASADYDLKKQYDFKKIGIIKKYNKDLPAISCEGSKIQQVFLNILRNGAEAMQEAGVENPTLTIKTYLEENGSWVTVEIDDNGPGMAEENRKRLFEPFFTTKSVGQGIGLGLSVAYFIITENHGGEMSVHSTLGTGTKFRIRLPLRENNKMEPNQR